MKKYFKILLIFTTLAILSCDKDDDVITPPDPPVPEPLVADAGVNQGGEPLDIVTLDGSASTGPTGFTYSWDYTGEVDESEINFQNKNTPKPTFTPPLNGNYSFKLTIAHDGKTDSDETMVTISGAIKIGGTLSENLELKNIQPNSSLPDYIVTSDLIVPDGISLAVIEDDVIISFEPETGIEVQSGGTLTNDCDSIEHGFTTEFNGDEGWKGILIDGGTIELEHATIVNAGKTAFTGEDEPAAIILTGDEPNIESISDNEFVNSYSYDILVNGSVIGYRTVVGNQLSYRIPIKAPITFMETWYSDDPNFFPELYDYIHLIPGGANSKDISTEPFIFTGKASGRYYIDGDFWAGSEVIIGPGNEILMAEGAGILAEEGFSTNGSAGSEVTISGIDGKNWKGIAAVQSGTQNADIQLRYTTISHAGHGIINIGGYRAEAPAVIYTDLPHRFGGSARNSNIIGSGGYGYYNAPAYRGFMGFEDCHFENTALAAIRTNAASIERLIYKVDHGNTFDLESTIPAVLVQGDGPATDKWYSLGGTNFYLIDAVLDRPTSADMNFLPGVRLKFKANRYLSWRSTAYILRIRGTSDDPVIFTGETEEPGSWGGLSLEGPFRIEHLTIKNGGGFILPRATEKANVVSAYPDEVTAPSQWLHNSTIANSAGWGIVIEPFTVDFDYDDPTKNNSFSDNANGNILNKNN